MSMYRQFWLAIVGCMLLAFGGSLIASMVSARAYLTSQLSMKNADNASALALSVSQSKPDRVSIELSVAALFDSGHYESIRVVDPDGRMMVERVNERVELDVPAWFVHWLPISAQPGLAQITDGWQQVGTITLLSHSRFAYNALWKIVQQTVAALAVACIAGGLLGTFILGRLKAPLQAVIEQATAISERRFVTIAEPNVPELQRLARAMNDSVKRLRALFEEEASRLETLRREANCDALTGLANRTHFVARLQQWLSGEDAADGTLLLIRLTNLAGVNRRLGRSATDTFLRHAAHAISECAGRDGAGLAARLNGADFAVVLHPTADAQAVGAAILASLTAVARGLAGSDAVASIGISRFLREAEIGQVLAQTDEALARAEARAGNAIEQTSGTGGESLPRAAGEWARLIQHALANQKLRLVSFPLVDRAGNVLHWECPLRLLSAEDGDWLPAGRFLPFAERFDLTPALDLAAVGLGLQALRENADLADVAINVSAGSLAHTGFRRSLLAMLEEESVLSRRLWLDVPESGAFRELGALREMCVGLQAVGCKVGLEHFGHHFSQVGQLHDLGLDYLKVDASFIRGIDCNAGNARFLRGVTGIAHNIGLLVLAEGVESQDELLALADLGFDGATGPWVSQRAVTGRGSARGDE